MKALQNNVAKQHCESIAKEFKRKCRRDEGSEGRTMRHSYDILGARMLWKPKEARIKKKFIEF